VKDDPTNLSAEHSSAERLTRAASAAQQLCEVLWESLHQELRGDPDTGRIKELSERLATVSSTVALLAAAAHRAPVGERRTPPAPVTPEPSPADPRAVPELRLASHPADSSTVSRAQGPGSVPEAPLAFERRSTSETPSSVESHSPSESPSGPRGPGEPESPVALQPIPTRAGDYTFTRLVDEHESVVTEEPHAPTGPAEPQIEIRDVRREEGPSAWVSSVGRLLARHSQDGLPFAVLLVEIVDVAHLERSETPHEMHGLVAQVEAALGRGMRSTDELSRETLGRYWLVTPETNGTGARMLAERLARLVRTSASHRGVPLEVAIGIAVCPEDGTEAPALAARADLGVYSARATGRSIAHTEPPAG
jgi:GGDEF domain-containing protein